MTVWLLLAIVPLATTLAAQASLDPLVTRADLWTMPKNEFVQSSKGLGFRWLSAAQDAGQSTMAGVSLFGTPVYQTNVQFSGDQLKALTVSFYNRGDAGELSKEQFQELLRKCVDALTTLTKMQPAVLGKNAASAVKAEGVQWQNGTTNFLLTYSFTREVKTQNIPFRAEFVRLEIAPVEKPKSFMESALSSTSTQAAAKFDGRAHVKRDAATGDVVLDGVPMVDQGQKGYCVVASAERVMRYYGVRTDEHELAQIANSSATEGTSNQAMLESLKKLANRLRIRVRVVEDFNVNEVLNLINNYNTVARRNKVPVIDTSSRVLDVTAIYQQMKPDLLREARTRNKSDSSRFMREVQARIDQGTPLLWSVMLGIVPEQKTPPVFGGHMRLIIGYNAKTEEILYSDSWGYGHELKRMPLADAWTITTGMNAIEPL